LLTLKSKSSSADRLTLNPVKESLEEGNEILHPGCTYKDSQSGVDMVKFHVDDRKCLQEIANEHFEKFGGTLSVQMPQQSKQLIIFGRDTSVYNQFTCNGWRKVPFAKEQWSGQEGFCFSIT